MGEVVRNEETQGKTREKRSPKLDLGVIQDDARLISVWVEGNLE